MTLIPTNTGIEIDLKKRKLHLLKRPLTKQTFKKVKTYPIAVGFYDGPGGEPDYPTPAGWYGVMAKARNPDWLMPDSPWVAPENRGKLIAGGDPANPIVARWIRLSDDGVGIHGTAARDSIGTAASHGCIRMLEEDVIELYAQVPKGTVVVIK